MTSRPAARRPNAVRRAALLVLAIAAVGIAFAFWNSTQPRVRLFVVNESALGATLRFGDGREVTVPACTSDRYGDDPTARWTLVVGDRRVASDGLGHLPSGTIVTLKVARDGRIASRVEAAIDTGVLAADAPDIGPCASEAPSG